MFWRRHVANMLVNNPAWKFSRVVLPYFVAKLHRDIFLCFRLRGLRCLCPLQLLLQLLWFRSGALHFVWRGDPCDGQLVWQLDVGGTRRNQFLKLLLLVDLCLQNFDLFVMRHARKVITVPTFLDLLTTRCRWRITLAFCFARSLSLCIQFPGQLLPRWLFSLLLLELHILKGGQGQAVGFTRYEL